MDKLTFAKEVTILVGENGSGKSTLLEAKAVAMRFNAEGGTKNFNFGTQNTHSELHQYLRLANPLVNIKMDRPAIGGPSIIDSYGGTSLHHQAHGESLLSLIEINRKSVLECIRPCFSR